MSFYRKAKLVAILLDGINDYWLDGAGLSFVLLANNGAFVFFNKYTTKRTTNVIANIPATLAPTIADSFPLDFEDGT